MFGVAKIFLVLLILGLKLVNSSNLDAGGRQKNLIQTFNFEDVCSPDGFKKEVGQNIKVYSTLNSFNVFSIFETP